MRESFILDPTKDPEFKNPKLQARIYSCRFLEAGVVAYPEDNETILLKQENLAAIAYKFKGAPVIIGHEDFWDNYRGELNVGYITKVYLNDDGWAWCDFVVDNEEAISLIEEKGYSVSCSYYASEWKKGGIYHNIPYDREITAGEAVHLALVPNPRYEDAFIIKNSKSGEKMKFIFKKKEKELPKNNADENVQEIELENALVEIGDEKIAVKDMIECFKNSKEEEKEEEKENECKENLLNEDDEIEVDGEKIKVAELMKVYKENKKKNEEDKEEDKKAKENALKEKSFNDLKQAKENADNEALKNNSSSQKIYFTNSDKIANGKKLYGSAQNIENK